MKMMTTKTSLSFLTVFLFIVCAAELTHGAIQPDTALAHFKKNNFLEFSKILDKANIIRYDLSLSLEFLLAEKIDLCRQQEISKDCDDLGFLTVLKTELGKVYPLEIRDITTNNLNVNLKEKLDILKTISKGLKQIEPGKIQLIDKFDQIIKSFEDGFSKIFGINLANFPEKITKFSKFLEVANGQKEALCEKLEDIWNTKKDFCRKFTTKAQRRSKPTYCDDFDSVNYYKGLIKRVFPLTTIDLFAVGSQDDLKTKLDVLTNPTPLSQKIDGFFDTIITTVQRGLAESSINLKD